MHIYKTYWHYGYSILDEKPPQIDTTADYIIIGHSIYFPHCVIIKRKDLQLFKGESRWIVPKRSLY